jgi:hypothetical protein
MLLLVKPGDSKKTLSLVAMCLVALDNIIQILTPTSTIKLRQGYVEA